MEQDIAQGAYKMWLTSLYGSYETALYKGVKAWHQLPEKAQIAWKETVQHIIFSVCEHDTSFCGLSFESVEERYKCYAEYKRYVALNEENK